MSTDYGCVVVQFPNFPAIRLSTVNHYAIAPGTERPWGYSPHSFLPSRKIRTWDGEVLCLSRADRSRLRTLIKKWNRRNGRSGSGHRTKRIPAYRTLWEE